MAIVGLIPTFDVLIGHVGVTGELIKSNLFYEISEFWPYPLFKDVVPVQEIPPFARYSLVNSRQIHTKQGIAVIERHYRAWFYDKENKPTSRISPFASAVFNLEKLTGGYINSIINIGSYRSANSEIRLTGKETGYEEETELYYVQLDFKEIELL